MVLLVPCRYYCSMNSICNDVILAKLSLSSLYHWPNIMLTCKDIDLKQFQPQDASGISLSSSQSIEDPEDTMQGPAGNERFTSNQSQVTYRRLIDRTNFYIHSIYHNRFDWKYSSQFPTNYPRVPRIVVKQSKDCYP